MSDERLATIFLELERLGYRALVMGGHAVRFHGVDRNTLDYDLHLALDDDGWSSLAATLACSPTLGGAVEGPSWRPESFRRFIVGRLPDGREERLEFWRKNHLLGSFDALAARAESGVYGGAVVTFLGLDDLIRSKETEREDDWRDVRLLEEIADLRRLANARSDAEVIRVLASLRSRRGVDAAIAAGHLENRDVLESAWSVASHPLSLAILAPYVPLLQAPPTVHGPIGEVIAGPLRGVVGGSVRHHALIEAVRRLYMRGRMQEDREDKARERAR